MAEAVTIAEFEKECLTFLEANAAPKRSTTSEKFVWGEGDDSVAILDEVDRAQELEDLARSKAWRAKRSDAGLGYIFGAPQYGGRGLPNSYDRLYAGLEARFEVPDQKFFGIGLGMIAPTIADHAQADAKARYLPALYRGDVVGCQLFSEPGAGSDLAGLQTQAVRDGEEWIVNGQKVWTSGAHYSDIGEIICRTDPDQPKHRGLTGFIVDMHAPGVEVKPLRQMTGGASFNEVFFTDVRIPDDHRLGDVNQGWTVALTTLMNERSSIGAGSGGGMGIASLGRLVEMLRHFGLAESRLHRDELMDLYIRFQVARYTNQRALDRMKAGQLPGPEMSIAKMALTDNLTRLAGFVARVLGPSLQADTGEWGTYAWSQVITGTPAMRIAGGSDEVLRNIVGERVLGLPKDPGVDTTSPFRDLLKN
jgi:alkylation response protein AidB-like acyl-CoA dehydrogenase